MTTITKPVITQQLQAMPDDGVEREVIRGQLRERGTARRNRKQARILVSLTGYLRNWLAALPVLRGELRVSDGAFRLAKNPDSIVGINVTCHSHEVAQRFADDAFLIDAAPILAAEILSPSDKHEAVVEKIEAYLTADVSRVWIIDPDLKSVQVDRPGQRPQVFNVSHEWTAEPELPGIRMPVAQLFET